MERDLLERSACTPIPLSNGVFNSACDIPYGCTIGQIEQAMFDWLDFLGFINLQLNERGLQRLEMMMMQANFSSLVGGIYAPSDHEILSDVGQESTSQRAS
ncbi:MAG: hypothetical protein SGI73_07295 [Chloroflexota bacterium]|nr:hypothetical protein [Chloroflexota bacterium]